MLSDAIIFLSQALKKCGSLINFDPAHLVEASIVERKSAESNLADKFVGIVSVALASRGHSSIDAWVWNWARKGMIGNFFEMKIVQKN